MTKLKKKLIALTLSTTLLAGLCTGCVPGKNVGSGDAKVLTVLMDQNDGWIKNFSPFTQGVYGFVQGFLFEPLVILDTYKNNEETMWLAEDVISEPDNKTLTIKLRKDIKWSDGEDFTADDVVFTYEYTKDKPEIDKNGDWDRKDEDGKITKGKINSITKVDDHTVKLVMNQENRFHRNTIFVNRWIVPEHIWKEIDDPANYIYKTDEPVGTGAFTKVKSFSPEMVVMSKNENYWKADELQVDELKVPQFNSNDAALTLLQTGSVDWAHIFIPNIDKTYIKGDKHKTYWYGTNDCVRLSMNYMTPNKGNAEAFNNADFKKAMSLAVDRKGIIDSAVYGYLSQEVPSNTGLPPALKGYQSEKAQKEMAKYTKYDIEAAKKLLADAGFKDINGDGYVETPTGKKIKFDIISVQGWTDWNDGAAIAAEGLRAIGIEASSKPKEQSIVIQHWQKGDWDMQYTAYGNSSDIYKFYFDTIGDTSRAKTDTWWSVCQTNYVNEKMSKLISELPTAKTDADVKKITDEIEIFFAENMINIPILYNGNWFVYNDSRFTGWSKTESDGQPAICFQDSKILQLLRLKAVK